MQLVKLMILARKIHRFLVLIIAVLGSIMTITGITLHRAGEGEWFFNINAYQARQLHNTLSTSFAILLGIMSLTGLLLYLYPYLQKWTRKSPPQQA